MSIAVRIADMARSARVAAQEIARASTDSKNGVLHSIADRLAAESERIQTENRRDVDLARQMKNDKHIINYSFDSQIEGEQIHFDFKLKEGICQNFNASQLMKKMGIEVNS